MAKAVEETLDMLGVKVRDRITGMEGVVTSICFDLYGCRQALLHRGMDKDDNPHNSGWLDTNRLVIIDPRPVMEQPSFDAPDKGPADKPIP